MIKEGIEGNVQKGSVILFWRPASGGRGRELHVGSVTRTFGASVLVEDFHYGQHPVSLAVPQIAAVLITAGEVWQAMKLARTGQSLDPLIIQPESVAAQ